MAKKKNIPASVAHILAALDFDAPHRGLDLALEFLRSPGDIAVHYQLTLADKALSLQTGNVVRQKLFGTEEQALHLLFAELHLRRAGLYQHPEIDQREKAKRDIHDAEKNCGNGVTAAAAALLLDVAIAYYAANYHERAVLAFRTIARPRNAADTSKISAKTLDNPVERSNRMRIRIPAIEWLLRVARDREQTNIADAFDEAERIYTIAAEACASPDAETLPSIDRRARARAGSGNDNARKADGEIGTLPAELLRLHAEARHGSGGCHMALGRYSNALAAYLDGLRLRGSLNRHMMDHTGLEAVSLAAIAHLYALLGNPKAGIYYRDALRTAKAAEKKRDVAPLVARAFEHLAAAQLTVRKYSTARDNLGRAATIYEVLNDTIGTARIHALEGDMLASEGNPDTAVERYRTAYIMFEMHSDKRFMAHVLIKLGRLYCDTKEFFNAIDRLHMALQIASDEKINDVRLQLNAHRELRRVYELKENWKKAFDHQKDAHSLELELIEKEQHRAIAMLQGSFDPEQAKRTGLQLRATQHELLKRNKRLVELGMRIVQQSECLEKLIKKTVLVQTQTAKHRRKTLADITELMQATRRSVADWQTFKEQSDEVYPGAMGRIQRRYNLTQAETKVCAIRMQGKSHKRIAEILCVETDTVDHHINAARKKMGLSQDDNMITRLQSLAEDENRNDIDDADGADGAEEYPGPEDDPRL
ncbi:MAG: Two-component system-sensor histidine kinase [Chlorobi bacterium]|nr:Two-component system-sensor histidine kinase [Chlorobiota bacterium]